MGISEIYKQQKKEIEELSKIKNRLMEEKEQVENICEQCKFREEFCWELVHNRQCVPRNGSTNNQ